MLKKFQILSLLCLLVLCSSLYASDEDALLQADIPVIYGEENFIKRIEERTGGTREPIGLVLSGGSARAFAHIGVLKYLEEHDIVPDFIISNSMGSIIGLLYSAGYSPDQIYEFCLNTPLTTLFNITLPINSGILDVQKFLSYAEKYIEPGTKLENLDIPIMVVGEDLVTKRTILITEGDFFKVFQASFALPFYFSSVEYDNHIIVDGGIANLVPLDLAYNYGNKNIVSTTFYNVKNINLKNPLTSLNVSFDIGKRRQGVLDIMNHPEAVWVRCDVEDVSFMEFSKIDYLVEKGYESAAAKEDGLENLVSQGHYSITEEMKTKREELEKTLIKEQKKYSLYNHVSFTDYSGSVGINGWTSCSSQEYSFFSNDLGLGLSFMSRYKNLDFKILGGVEARLTNGGWVLPSLSAHSNLYLGRLKFSVSTDGVFSLGKEAKLYSSFYINQSAQYKFSDINEFQFNIAESAEYIYDKQNLRETYWQGDSGLISLTGNIQLTKNSKSVKFRVGPQYIVTKDGLRSYLYGKFESSFNNNDINAVIHTFFMDRFSLNSNYNSFLTIKDGFYTSNPEYLKCGVPGQSSSIDKRNLVIAGIEGGYVSPETKSIAELLLIDTFSIKGFTTFMWFNDETPLSPDINFGLKFSGDTSLIGLSTLPVEMVISYNTTSQEVYWGLNFGN